MTDGRPIHRAGRGPVALLLPALGLLALTPSPRSLGLPAVAQLRERLRQTPVTFLPAPHDPGLEVRARDRTYRFEAGGVTIRLRRRPAPAETPPGAGDGGTVRIEFAGARAGVEPAGEQPAPGTVSYFRGEPSQWRTGLPTYASLRYRELWPGIDLVYRGEGPRLKYEFQLQPGADPARVGLVYHGAQLARIAPDGSLELDTAAGTLNDAAPVAYQEIDGRRVPIPCSFRLGIGTTKDTKDTKGEGGAPLPTPTSYSYSTARSPAHPRTPAPAQVCFTLGAYDKTRPLVIDPAVLLSCGYVGGTEPDEVRGVAVDAAGYVYVCGFTKSPNDNGYDQFPAVVGPDLTYNDPDSGYDGDAFVAKLLPDGSGFVYCGYIGGARKDVANGIAVDAAGCAYVVGSTASHQNSFPVRAGPDLLYRGGSSYGPGDGWIAKVLADGTGLEYCGYVAGGRDDEATGVAVDAVGRATIVGTTVSAGAGFPEKIGPMLSGPSLGNSDAFVARVQADGRDFEYSGFIGGQGYDTGAGVALDADGGAWVVGTTRVGRRQSGLPVQVGPDLTFNGDEDAFVARVRPDGSGFVSCGYLGGKDGDSGNAIAIDIHGSVYVAGNTTSQADTFPVRVGPDLTQNDRSRNSFWDAFVAKLRPDGTGLEYCGYVGGARTDLGLGLAVDAVGSAYLVGTTTSGPTSFPARNGPDLQYQGAIEHLWRQTYNYQNDGFIARVRADGSGLEYCGYIGGRGSEDAAAVALAPDGDAWVAGTVKFGSAYFPQRGGPQSVYNSGEEAGVTGDGFVARVRLLPEVAAPGRLYVTPPGLDFGFAPAGSTVTRRTELRNWGSGPLWVDVPALTPPFSVDRPGPVEIPPGGRVPLVLTFRSDPEEWGAVAWMTLVSSDPQAPIYRVRLTGVRR